MILGDLKKDMNELDATKKSCKNRVQLFMYQPKWNKSFPNAPLDSCPPMQAVLWIRSCLYKKNTTRQAASKYMASGKVPFCAAEHSKTRAEGGAAQDTRKRARAHTHLSNLRRFNYRVRLVTSAPCQSKWRGGITVGTLKFIFAQPLSFLFTISTHPASVYLSSNQRSV